MNNKNVTKVTRQASVCLSKLGRDKKKKWEGYRWCGDNTRTDSRHREQFRGGPAPPLIHRSFAIVLTLLIQESGFDRGRNSATFPPR